MRVEWHFVARLIKEQLKAPRAQEPRERVLERETGPEADRPRRSCQRLITRSTADMIQHRDREQRETERDREKD